MGPHGRTPARAPAFLVYRASVPVQPGKNGSRAADAIPRFPSAQWLDNVVRHNTTKNSAKLPFPAPGSALDRHARELPRDRRRLLVNCADPRKTFADSENGNPIRAIEPALQPSWHVPGRLRR